MGQNGAVIGNQLSTHKNMIFNVDVTTYVTVMCNVPYHIFCKGSKEQNQGKKGSACNGQKVHDMAFLPKEKLRFSKKGRSTSKTPVKPPMWLLKGGDGCKPPHVVNLLRNAPPPPPAHPSLTRFHRGGALIVKQTR